MQAIRREESLRTWERLSPNLDLSLCLFVRVIWRILITFPPDKRTQDVLSILLFHKMFFQGFKEPIPIRAGAKGHT